MCMCVCMCYVDGHAQHVYVLGWRVHATHSSMCVWLCYMYMAIVCAHAYVYMCVYYCLCKCTQA